VLIKGTNRRLLLYETSHIIASALIFQVLLTKFKLASGWSAGNILTVATNYADSGIVYNLPGKTCLRGSYEMIKLSLFSNITVRHETCDTDASKICVRDTVDANLDSA